MKKSLITIVTVLGIGFTACTSQNNSAQKHNVAEVVNKPKHNMKNLISIVEIPVRDFSKAVAFYQEILDVSIEEVDMGGIQMGVLPSDGETVNLALVKGSDYKPTTDGAVLYLNAGNDLQPMLDKIARKGGKVIVPKTQISPDMGFFALFIDPEGNKLGLHSKN